jgi:competence protein ComFC
MKCIICDKLSLYIICKTCQKSYLTPTISKRVLPSGLTVYSFYPYSQIERFIKTKHTYKGFGIYKILAKNSFEIFAKSFEYERQVYALAVDDRVKEDYAHTAILTKALKSKYIKPVFNTLRAKNSVSYSAKSLEFRLKNPRDFSYTFKRDIDVILVDDIITTGTTLSEAYTLLKKQDVNTLFALTLADARQ